MALLRLDKYLCEMGCGTRTQVKEAARKGRILVNGQVEKHGDRKVDPALDTVAMDGENVSYVRYEYYMLNKPQGVVSATEDGRHATAVSLIDGSQRADLFPAGRLDIDTEGLLLITNDGELAHRLLSPRRHVDKVYYAKAIGLLCADAGEQFEKGILLDSKTRAMPARLEHAGVDGDESCLFITVHEGKFHQVKRMVEAVGGRVTYLKRLSMGPLKLDEDLSPGEYRPLTEAELKALKTCAGLL